ncbi:hypothetical protein J6590_077192 [Homalodisca vitripennis]|nr:hypothetical protein J6590_077192 [Homalodisca vitripennis]
MLTSGLQLIMEASFPAEQEKPRNWYLRPPKMREQPEARIPLLDLAKPGSRLRTGSVGRGFPEVVDRIKADAEDTDDLHPD